VIHVAQREHLAQQNCVLVARALPGAFAPELASERYPFEKAEPDVRIADVDGQKHG
jgi:hypothetical protein